MSLELRSHTNRPASDARHAPPWARPPAGVVAGCLQWLFEMFERSPHCISMVPFLAVSWYSSNFWLMLIPVAPMRLA